MSSKLWKFVHSNIIRYTKKELLKYTKPKLINLILYGLYNNMDNYRNKF